MLLVRREALSRVFEADPLYDLLQVCFRTGPETLRRVCDGVYERQASRVGRMGRARGLTESIAGR